MKYTRSREEYDNYLEKDKKAAWTTSILGTVTLAAVLYFLGNNPLLGYTILMISIVIASICSCEASNSRMELLLFKEGDRVTRVKAEPWHSALEVVSIGNTKYLLRDTATGSELEVNFSDQDQFQKEQGEVF